MSVQSARVARQSLERSGLLSAALPTLAILVGLPPPRTKGLNPQPHFTLQYKIFLLLVRLMAGQSVEVNIRRAGDLSQALTQNFQIKGKSDSFPPRFDLTDYNDFDLSKTEKNLAVPAVSTNAQQITIQNRDDDVYELTARFDVIASATFDGTSFETRLKEGCLTENAHPTVDLITDPDPFMIMAGEKSSGVLDVIPLPYSVNVCYSNIPRRRISTESLCDDGPTMFDHEVTSGRLVIPADGSATTLDVQTMESGPPKSEEEFLIAFQFEGHNPITPKYRAVNSFTSDSATKMVVVKVMDLDTPPPSQHLVNLHGCTSNELTNRPQGALKEDENTELSVTRIGDAALSKFTISPKSRELPANETNFGDYQIHTSVTIGSGLKSGSITLGNIDDSLGERHYDLLTIGIDNTSGCWPSGYTKGDRWWFRVVMESNDETPGNLLSLSTAALTKASAPSTAMYQYQLAYYRV